jgi:hypothetical protein
MKTLYLLLLFVLFGSINYISAQVSEQIKEITQSDLTPYPGPKWDKISVFRIRLGMSIDSVNLILSQNKQLYYYEDKNHRTQDYRIYVYDKDEFGSKKNCILYLIWSKSCPGLSRITFFEDFEPYLIDFSKKLLTTDPFLKDSRITKNCLGEPDEQKVTLDIPSIKTKHTTNFYKSRGIQVTLKENGENETVVFAIYNPNVPEL